jgi:hypothetical protein
LVGDSHADPVVVENIIVGAFQAEFVVPVPSGTAQISRLFLRGFLASAGHKYVPCIA